VPVPASDDQLLLTFSSPNLAVEEAMVARRSGAWAWGTGSAVLLTMVLVAGCGGSDGLDTSAGSPSPSDPAATPSTSTPAATPTASPTASSSATVDAKSADESAVATDFLLYVNGLAHALHIRNDRVRDMIEYSTPQRQSVDRGNIADLRQRHIVFKGTAKDWVGPVVIVGNRATLQLCERDDTSWYEYESTGKVAGTKLDRWNPYEIRLIKRDGRWQINTLTPAKKISCKAAK
jgi:hypothetical protein